MSKIVRSLALMAAMAGLVAASGLAVAPAQDKKTDPKVDPKTKVTTQPAKDAVGKVEVYEAKDGWRFKVMNTEGKTIAMGTTGFEKKEDCLKVLDLVKTTLNKAKVDVVEKK